MYGDKKADPFYKSKAWRKVRAARLLMDNGKCCDCMNLYLHHGGPGPRDAVMVHHEISREERPDLALDINNLRSLCDSCHNKRHPEKGKKDEESSAVRGGILIVKV